MKIPDFKKAPDFIKLTVLVIFLINSLVSVGIVGFFASWAGGYIFGYDVGQVLGPNSYSFAGCIRGCTTELAYAIYHSHYAWILSLPILLSAFFVWWFKFPVFKDKDRI